MFRTREDTDLGTDVVVNVIRLNDDGGTWTIGRLKKPGSGGKYTIRCWAENATTIVVYGGGSTNNHSIGSDWNDVSGSLTDAQVTSNTVALIAGGSEIVEVSQFDFVQ